MIFSISSNLDKASKITESSFTGLNIWERQHIEEWVRTNPEMLGEDLLVPCLVNPFLLLVYAV